MIWWWSHRSGRITLILMERMSDEITYANLSMKTSSMRYWYNCDHMCISLIYDDIWDPDVVLWWLIWSTVHEIIYTHWDIYWTDRLISAWWDLDLHAWWCANSIQNELRGFDHVFFFIFISLMMLDIYNDMMMIPSIRTYYFDTHGTYEWWDYICKFKYENVVDEILI